MRHGKYPWKQRQSSYGSRQEAILRVAVNAIVAIILLLPRVSLTLAAYESPRILGPELQFDLVVNCFFSTVTIHFGASPKLAISHRTSRS